MESIEVVDELRDLRRELHTAAQGTKRKIQRAAWLNENDFDFGEEAIRLRHLQHDIDGQRDTIRETIAKITKGDAMGEAACDLFYDISKDVRFTQSTLDEIKVPKIQQVLRAELRNTY